jgi:cytidylate kinase
MKKIIIAIDGYSSCGKSTMAKDLAASVGYQYIDSGAMYRAVTLYAIQKNLFIGEELNIPALQEAMKDIDISFKPGDREGISDTYLNGENVETQIRSMEVANKVSIVSSLKFVREGLVEQQKKMSKHKGIVMDGRDIGTVVFPQAELKIFVTARPEVRAQRRWDELKNKGEETSFEAVLENIKKRDLIDTTRAESPLKQAEDAIVLDNSDISIEEQKKWLLEQFNYSVLKKEGKC